MKKTSFLLFLLSFNFFYGQNSCIPSGSFVVNGDFEAAASCNLIDNNPGWQPFVDTPDVFVRGCVISNNFNTGVSTYGSIPASETHNFLVPTNNNFMGVYAIENVTTESVYYNSEVTQTILNNNLIPGSTYQLSFWAKVNNSPAESIPAASTLQMAPVEFAVMPLGNGAEGFYDQVWFDVVDNNTTFQDFFPQSYRVASQVVPNDNEWHCYTTSFTVPQTIGNQKVLVIYIGRNFETSSSYIFLDDVSIMPKDESTDVVFNLPSTICLNSVIEDMGVYLSMTNNGTFSGNGVIDDAFTALEVGNQIISYEYFNEGCCSVVLTDTILVLDSDNLNCSCLNDVTLVVPDNENLYHRHEFIIAKEDYSVSGSKSVTLKAGSYIDLLPDTYYNTNNFFEAYIEDCE